jgi:hypothetical protein
MNLTQELTEELEAFNPRWQQVYAHKRAAACAAGVLDLFNRWLETDDGKHYQAAFLGVRDYASEGRRRVEAEMEQPKSLPYGFGNLGWVKGSIDG